MQIPKVESAAVVGDDAGVDRKVIVTLRLTAAERDAWDAAAKRAGLTLSDWIRLRCQGPQAVPDAAIVKPTTKRRRS